jgi:hypothetical protein
MKKLFCFLIVLLIGFANIANAEYFDLSNFNKRASDFNIYKIQTPKFETPKLEPADLIFKNQRKESKIFKPEELKNSKK